MDQFTDEFVLLMPTAAAPEMSTPDMHACGEENDGTPLDADTGATYGATCVISYLNYFAYIIITPARPRLPLLPPNPPLSCVLAQSFFGRMYPALLARTYPTALRFPSIMATWRCIYFGDICCPRLHRIPRATRVGLSHLAAFVVASLDSVFPDILNENAAEDHLPAMFDFVDYVDPCLLGGNIDTPLLGLMSTALLSEGIIKSLATIFYTLTHTDDMLSGSPLFGSKMVRRCLMLLNRLLAVFEHDLLPAVVSCEAAHMLDPLLLSLLDNILAAPLIYYRNMAVVDSALPYVLQHQLVDTPAVRSSSLRSLESKKDWCEGTHRKHCEPHGSVRLGQQLFTRDRACMRALLDDYNTAKYDVIYPEQVSFMARHPGAPFFSLRLPQGERRLEEQFCPRPPIAGMAISDSSENHYILVPFHREIFNPHDILTNIAGRFLAPDMPLPRLIEVIRNAMEDGDIKEKMTH
ncbi:hypothetical protein DFH09DRAFT_1423904 [Mycena vulgaris]|nr:hypothetical protein DFH09DRAFT_1423904 [Mycena vulgaris]